MDSILKNSSKFLKLCRELEIPVLYTIHINRGDGVGLANNEPINEQGEPIYYHSLTENIEIADEIKPTTNDIIIDKYRYSGFFGTSLDLILKDLDIKHLIIGGVLTDVCVLSTAYDAFYNNYQVNIVKDMCGTTSEGAHKAAMLIMANWIYDIKVFNTENMICKLKREDYKVWEPNEPELLQFTENNIREKYDQLKRNS